MVSLAKEVHYVPQGKYEGPFFLSADIGGTNSNFGIFTTGYTKPLLLASLHYKSKDITDFAPFMSQVVYYIAKKYGITFEKGCIGAAGIIYPTRLEVKPTNLDFKISIPEIMERISFKKLLLINDFEAVALGLELLGPDDIVTVQGGVGYPHANKSFVGAGTGLGKSVLSWHDESKRYLPLVSEGGHADAAFYKEEVGLMEFITARYGQDPVSWEALLSGAGIQRMYQFLGTTKRYPITEATKEIEAHDLNPDRISFYAKEDKQCADTFNFYVTFYARCAKNFALDSLSLNGMYIAGGIAAKNISMFFDPRFIKEFTHCVRHREILMQIPIFIIANYNVNLYGSVVAEWLHERHLL